MMCDCFNYLSLSQVTLLRVGTPRHMARCLGLACPILSAVCRIDVFLFSWQSGDDIRGSHLLGSATSKGCDYSTLARETQCISDAVPPLCRLSSSVSLPRRTDPGVWRASCGPGRQWQRCSKQKSTNGCQVKGRLIQIDHVTCMREIQQGRVVQRRLVLPGDRPFDIVTGSGQNKGRGVIRGEQRARIDVSMPVLGIGGGKDVVVEAIALHLPFGQVSRVTDGSLGDALDERIKERIRFPIRHQSMCGSRIDQSEQIPGDETRRIECVVILLLCCCRKPRGDQAFIRPLG